MTRLGIIFFNRLTRIALTLSTTPCFAEAKRGGLNETLGSLVPFFLMIGIFYFLVLRPQQQQRKQHQTFLAGLKKGDMVVTQAGIVGSVRSVSEKFVQLEVDDGVCLKIVRGQIADSAANLKEDGQPKS